MESNIHLPVAAILALFVLVPGVAAAQPGTAAPVPGYEPWLLAAVERDPVMNVRRADLARADRQLEAAEHPSRLVAEATTGTIKYSFPAEPSVDRLEAAPSITLQLADPVGTKISAGVGLSSQTGSKAGFYPSIQVEQALENLVFPRADLSLATKRQAVLDARTAIVTRIAEVRIATLGLLRDWAAAGRALSQKNLAYEGAKRDYDNAIQLKTYSSGSVSMKRLENALRAAEIARQRAEMALAAAKAAVAEACGTLAGGTLAGGTLSGGQTAGDAVPETPSNPFPKAPALDVTQSYSVSRAKTAWEQETASFEASYGPFQPKLGIALSASTQAIPASDTTALSFSGSTSLGLEDWSVQGGGGWDGRTETPYLSVSGSWKPGDKAVKTANRQAAEASLLSRKYALDAAISQAGDAIDSTLRDFELAELESENLGANLELAKLDVLESRAKVAAGIAAPAELDTTRIAMEKAASDAETAAWNRVISVERLKVNYDIKEIQP